MQEATEGMPRTDLTILLSHDPSHWDDEVVHGYPQVDLTLSGHTHGFQFGIEITDRLKWSPVQYVYRKWAGLYQQGKQYLYVNRGLGFLGYPGRVGILPEITLLTIRDRQA
jgi:predicted MPP superfamily phosphohydrolase